LIIYGQARNDKTTNNNSESAMSEFDHLTTYFESTNDIAYTVLWDLVPTAPPCNGEPQEERVDSAATPVIPACVSNPKISSLLLSHTKLDNFHSSQKDHTEDSSMRGLRMEGVMCRDHQQLGDNTHRYYKFSLPYPTFSSN
jgi:hypothetical protein